MVRILTVLSGSDHRTLSDGTRHPIGCWVEEFVEPHRTFRHAEVDVGIATPGGVQPIVDQVSLTPDRTGGDERAAELRSSSGYGPAGLLAGRCKDGAWPTTPTAIGEPTG